MKIYIGSDHAGFEYKQHIIDYFSNNNNYYSGVLVLSVEDCGCFSINSVDYPDIAKIVCEKIHDDLDNKIYSLGILICGTGIGMSIAANKHDYIRCALINDLYNAELAKKHNNANIIALGSRTIDKNNIIPIINTFLDSKFERSRHQTRIDKISFLDKK